MGGREEGGASVKKDHHCDDGHNDGVDNAQVKGCGILVVPGLQDDDRHSDSLASSESGSAMCSSNGKSNSTKRNFPWSQANYTRIIIQALHSMGYNKSAAELEAESGLQLHTGSVSKLQTAVLAGDWVEVDSLLGELEIPQADLGDCLYEARRQRYLELLEANKTQEAIDFLQSHITPLKMKDKGVLHALTSLVVFRNKDDLRRQARWEGPTLNERRRMLEQLRKHIPPHILLPPNRLETLMSQALEHQVQQCVRYNCMEPWTDLLQDCVAGPNSVPEKCLHSLDMHHDEVWYVQFSHDGLSLATASKDKTVIVWALDRQAPGVRHTLRGHADSVSFVAWSPDDTRLLSCDNEKVIRLWDMCSGDMLREYKGHTETVTAIAWMPDGKQFVSGGYDKKICVWRIDSSEPVSVWGGERVCDLALSADGRKMVTISPDKKIRSYLMPSKTEISCVTESECLTSLCLSDDGRYALVNISSESKPEVHLWDLEEQTIIQRFRGHRQARYVIRSCFGGVRNSFVVCGSEDSLVYVWHWTTGSLVATLSGHAGTINSVAWSGARNGLIASVSDDNTVRIWGCARDGARCDA